MLLKNWLTSLRQNIRKPSRPSRRKGSTYHHAAVKPIAAQAEILEERVLLTDFVVTTLDDVVLEDGLVSLREAILSANNDDPINDDVTMGGTADDDTISFGPLIVGGTIEIDDSLGPLEITDDVLINGADPLSLMPNITISGQNLSRIFTINTSDFVGNDRDVVLSNLILTEGNTDTDGGAILVTDGEDVTLNGVEITSSSADGNGGAIFAGDGMLTINDSQIGTAAAGNQAFNGGGIYVDGGILTLDNTEVSSNTATGNGSITHGGGGIYSLGGTVNVQNGSIVTLNSATGSAVGSGGGILANGGSLSITSSTISNNDAIRAGGGIETNDASTAVTVTMTTSNLTGNMVGNSPGNGGGLHITSPSTSANTTTATITGGAVTGNSAAAEGGGLWNDVRGTLTINGVVISGNTASGNLADQGGGGVFNNGGTVTIQNDNLTATTISGNFADGTAGSGGGILNDGGTLTITNAFITGNEARRAGGGIEATTQNNRNSIISLNGVTITNNDAISGVTMSPGNGGGVHITDVVGGNTSSFTMTGGSVSSNSAREEGGGLWNAEGGTMIINGVSITGNTASGDGVDQGGGGIFNDGGTVTIQNNETTSTTISGNIADGTAGSGGGILNDGGTLNITDAMILSNIANRAGGGIEATTLNSRNSSVTLTDVVIIGNLAIGGLTATAPGNGGGVHITDLTGGNTSTFTMTRGEVTSNSALAEGGGLWNAVGGTMNIRGVDINNNTASGTDSNQGGGGIFNDGGTINIQNSATVETQIRSNIAVAGSGSGGGILNDGGTINMTGGTISGNMAGRAGGGIEVNADTRNSVVTLTRTTITGNAASSNPGNGGGVHISDAADGTSSTFTLNRGTVSNNFASAEGGGLWNDLGGTLNINGTTISGNTASGTTLGQGGGGIFNRGGTVNIQDQFNTTTITSNVANGGTLGSGGGILNSGGTITMTGGTITGNNAVRAGGGIEATTIANRNSVVTLTNTVISRNFAGGTPGNGGGVHISDEEGDETSTFTLTGGAVTGNLALAEGGGLWNDGGGTLNIDGTLIESNTASGSSADQGGGGIFNEGGIVNITSNTATTIIAGNVAGGIGSASGGGILNDGGMLTIVGAVIDGNAARRAGGGIEVTDANDRASTVVVTNTTISNNQVGSSPGNGGGVHITDTTDDNATVMFTLASSTVTGNSAASEGGGLWNDVESTLTITGSTITGNTASGDDDTNGGGGVFNNGGTVIIQAGTSNTIIAGNVADGTAGSGGGILNDGGTLTISGTDITSNTAMRAGGGIEATTANSRDSDITITTSTISGNFVGSAPGNGGGVHISDTTGGMSSLFSITDSVVSGNTAASEGGGLWNDADGTMVITSTTISGNTASGNDATNGGGGVFNNGGAVMIQAGTTISNNVANGTSGSGGGILNDGGMLTITGTNITGNTAMRAGGGIEATTANSRDSDITITMSTISNNVTGSAPGNGGGVHISDTAGGNSSMFSITDSTVSGNSAAREGGGLWNDAGGTMVVTSTTISGNTASGTASTNGGGGIFNNGGTVDVTTSTLLNNSANGTLGQGGGIFNKMGGNFDVLQSTIRQNTAANNGGGIFNEATMTVEDSTLSSNSADNDGGGLWNSSVLDVIQATISGNTADADGGGIFTGGSSTLNVSNSTITLNDADNGDGGGIANSGGTLTLQSTIVAENTAGTTTEDVSGTVQNTSQFNLIGINTGLTGIMNGEGDNQIGTPGSPLDPQLGPLANNGGPTQTHRLLDNSPAINAGSNPENLPFDQRGDGFPRSIGQTDIGAFEAQFLIMAVGSGPGMGTVKVYNSLTGEEVATVTPYPGFTGGVRVAVGDVNGDGTLDLITGAGPGGGPHVKVFDGSSPNFMTEIESFFPFPMGFSGGVYLATANFNPNEDDNADIVIGAGPGGGPNVVVFSGADINTTIDDSTVFQNFFPYNPIFTGGVTVATGDITGDGTPDIITGAGPGGGPHVRVFDGSIMQDTGAPNDIGGERGSFFPFPMGFGGGVFVAGGDIDGDGRDDIIAGAGAGGGPNVVVRSGVDGSELYNFFAYDPAFPGGVRVGTVQGPNSDGVDDIITGPGMGGGPNVRIFSRDNLTSLIPTPDANFNAFAGDFTGGIFVAGGLPLTESTDGPTLLFGGGLSAGDTTPLTQSQAEALAAAALTRLASSGVSAAAIQELSTVDVQVADLNEGVLGRALPGLILIDGNASGAGWFIDSTPLADEEFDANLTAIDASALGRVDLLTVLMHEFGHQLGADDLGIFEHPEHLMAESLPTGQRRLPTDDLDALFADGDLFDSLLN